jgi:sigma-B regulation protein RsbU (phosphoserine phosphatase)
VLPAGAGRAGTVHGTLLGVCPHVALTEVAFELRDGEMMVLYTDGVTEVRGVDGFYGAGRLVKVVGSVKHPSGETVVDRLRADIKAFQRARLHDDIAILVIEATP